MGRAGRSVLYALLAGLAFLWIGPALALDAAQDINQYAHTAWRYRDGFARSFITSIAQTPDGYLWLGTGAGLWRFDGVRAIAWPQHGPPLADNRIRSLLAARDGTLWVGTLNGLAQMKDGAFIRVPQLDGDTVSGLAEDRDGTLWAAAVPAGTNAGEKLCHMRGIRADCSPVDGGTGAGTLYQDRASRLWLLTGKDLWQWKPGPPHRYPFPNRGELQSITEDSNGALLLVSAIGVQKFSNGKFASVPLPPTSYTDSALVDRDGAVWVGTQEGLIHLHNGRTDAFTQPDGLSGREPSRIFEDREGDIWVATRTGLDRFRTLPATTYSSAQGVGGGGTGSILADPDGSTWMDGIDALYRWQVGKLTVYRAPGDKSPPGPDGKIILGLPRRSFGSLLRDSQGRIWLGSMTGLGYFQNNRFTPVPGLPDGYVDSMAEDGQGNLWIAHRSGLFRLSSDLALERVSLSFPGNKIPFRLASDPVHGGLWGGFPNGGLVHFLDGKVVASYGPEGFAKGFIMDIRVTPDGAVWVAGEGGFSRIRNNRVATLDSKNGLSCDAVHASLEDDDHAMWIYTACGMVRIPHAEMAAWTAAADAGKPLPEVHPTLFDESDGVPSMSTPGSTASPHMTRAIDGKLWLVATEGVISMDPRHLALNRLPPPVQIEEIVADGKKYGHGPGLRLPALTRNLTINYTALSLVAPEKMHFRYRLEGQDREWREVVNERTVQYSNLAPGNYIFRVTASNNSGVWNDGGAALAFSIAPAYWQTSWFLALCVAALAGTLASLYRWRLHQVANAAARIREIERRQDEARVELAHANRLATMGQLTASVAHEVNQPLGAVMMNAQAALRWLSVPPNIDEARTVLGRIVRDVGRAADIVKRVRVMAKKGPEHRENIDINEAVEEVIAITAGEAGKHQIVIKEHFAPDLPTVWADRVELQQVVLNLLMNAIEAMGAPAAEQREITVQTELNEARELQVSVRDFGPGIAPDALERIFQPFYTSKDTGLGMGLSICRTLIEAHDGRLWASANSPHGAVFTFTLPQTQTDSRRPADD